MSLDIRALAVWFRGYPVTMLSEEAAAVIQGDGQGSGDQIREVLSVAHDTAGPGEPSGWMFESDVSGHLVCIERFGGSRSADQHHGGMWSVYLPHER